jgi:hypothetical protein
VYITPRERFHNIPLQEIRKGAELKPLLEKLVLAEKVRQNRRTSGATPVTPRPKETKMVTFKDEADVTEAKTSDAFI